MPITSHIAGASYVAVALLLVSTPLAGETAGVVLSIDGAGAIVVPVSVNGSEPMPFLLDTGSTHSVVSTSLAERLRLPLVGKTEVLTSAGRDLRPVAGITSVAIGSVASERLMASVVPAAKLAIIAPGIEGIIGQDFLSGLNYTLDYRRGRLVWAAEAWEEGGTRLPLLAREGRYLVELSSSAGEVPMMLVPDSGASGFVIFERAGRPRLGAMLERGSVTVSGLAGERAVRMALVPELRVGDITLSHQAVAVIDREAGDASEGDGLLPLHLFSSVSFNSREGYLLLRTN
jgi:predicted aspartyl protease